MPRLPVASCWRRWRHWVSLSPASLTTWNGSRTSLAWGTAFLTACLYPANASIATTRTFLLNSSEREASHPANAAPLLPSTTSRRRAGRPSLLGVRSTTTVTYLEPRDVCRHTCSSTPRWVTPSRRCSSPARCFMPLAGTASFAQSHKHPSVAATLRTLIASSTTEATAHHAARSVSRRPSAATRDRSSSHAPPHPRHS